MSALASLLGEKLLGKEGEVATVDALSTAKAVGLYFSAHWCPPCRGFTPELAKTYEGMKASGKGFEVVFVSSDRDEDGFKEYYGEMPWLALPYAARDLKNKLSKKFKVQGIPMLVILDGATGELITTDGREAVSEDPTGDNFPWKPPTVWEALGDEVLNGEGEDVSIADLRGAGKVLGLYFSAEWCPPCHAFTPKLAATYKAVKAAGKEFEIVFVSSDRSMEQFQKYFSTMPWLAIPQGDPRKAKLSTLYGVQGIPTLVILDADSGSVINPNARGAVAADPEGASFPWSPPPVGDLSSPDGINEETSLCVLIDGCTKEVQEAALAVLTPIAEASKASGAEMLFFAAKSADGAVPQIRNLCKVGDATPAPKMVLIDIPDEGGFYVSDATELTAEVINGFIKQYKAGSLERKQLG